MSPTTWPASWRTKAKPNEARGLLRYAAGTPALAHRDEATFAPEDHDPVRHGRTVLTRPRDQSGSRGSSPLAVGPGTAPAAVSPRLRPVEPQALAVEAVDDVSVLHAVERDDVDDVLPAQRADLDPPPGRLEPVAEPGVALSGVILDTAADLAADGVEHEVPLEDPVIEPGLGGQDDEGEVLHLLGRPLGAAEGLGDACHAPRRLVVIGGVPHSGREPGEQLGFEYDELPRLGRQRECRRAGIADDEMAENAVGMRPRLGEPVASIAGQERRREPRLRRTTSPGIGESGYRSPPCRENQSRMIRSSQSSLNSSVGGNAAVPASHASSIALIRSTIIGPTLAPILFRHHSPPAAVGLAIGTNLDWAASLGRMLTSRPRVRLPWPYLTSPLPDLVSCTSVDRPERTIAVFRRPSERPFVKYRDDPHFPGEFGFNRVAILNRLPPPVPSRPIPSTRPHRHVRRLLDLPSPHLDTGRCRRAAANASTIIVPHSMACVDWPSSVC